MKKITLVYESLGDKETLVLEGKGCGYRVEDGAYITVWLNTEEMNSTRVVPMSRVISLTQEN